jgi:hypothetical protein
MRVQSNQKPSKITNICRLKKVTASSGLSEDFKNKAGLWGLSF